MAKRLRDFNVDVAIRTQKAITKRLKKEAKLKELVEANMKLSRSLKPSRKLSPKQRKLLLSAERFGRKGFAAGLDLVFGKQKKRRKR